MPVTFVVTSGLKPEPLREEKLEEKLEEKDCIVKYRETRDINSTTENGFFWTVVEAYNEHRNLVLRPDDVWIAIMVQFSFYTKARGDELRSKFVDFKGKKNLQVATLCTTDYEKLAKEMANEISKNVIDPDLKAWIVPNFSTTEDVDRVVGSMILMATASNYFGYSFMLCCGLPSVTLEGTVEDWKLLEKKIEKLLEYDSKECYMERWLKLLRPVLSQFTASFEKPDVSFWKNVCSNHGNGSGPRYLSGWITVFSVFSERGRWRGDSTSIDISNNGVICIGYTGGSSSERRKESRKPIYGVDYLAHKPWPIIDTQDISVGKVEVDVKVDDNGEKHDCKLTAGHFYIRKVDKFTIQPGVGWSIRKK